MFGRLLADVLRVRNTFLAPQTSTSEPARAWQGPRLPVGSKVVAEGELSPVPATPLKVPTAFYVKTLL